jgi:hypothetical protein
MRLALPRKMIESMAPAEAGAPKSDRCESMFGPRISSVVKAVPRSSLSRQLLMSCELLFVLIDKAFLTHNGKSIHTPFMLRPNKAFERTVASVPLAMHSSRCSSPAAQCLR